MRSRTATVAAVALTGTLAVTGCAGASLGDGPTGPSVTPGPRTTAGGSVAGPFTLPASACDLVTQAAVEKVAGRDSLRLTATGTRPTGSATAVASAAMTCAFTDGVVPVGLLTVDVRLATAGRTAEQELDDSVAGSLYRSSTTEAVPGLGDAARYGKALAISDLHYATVWTVTLGDGQVGDLTLTVASADPDAARSGLVDLTRTALTEMASGATPTPGT